MAGPLSQRRPERAKTVGVMRHRVTIQRKASSPERDASGAEVETWESVSGVATVWASVEPVGGAEMMRNGQVQASTTYKVTVRHRDGITPDMRFVWVTSKPANKVLNITAAPPTVGAGNSLELVCIEEN